MAGMKELLEWSVRTYLVGSTVLRWKQAIQFVRRA